jgi:O-antigen/teichoic acid export membrane protein
MVSATFIGGIFMAFVQTAANRMPTTEYNTFNALLGLLIILGGVPSAALQTIFAQQAAAAVTEEKECALNTAVRALLKVTGLFWLIIALWIWLFTGGVSQFLRIGEPQALRLTALIVLCTLWLPILKGVLQGQHRFAPLGWLIMCEGAGRLGIMILIVVVLKGHATGGVVAVFAGQLGTLVIAGWLTRQVWLRADSATFHWKQWLKRGAPLTLGMGAVMFISSVDRIFVNSLFFEHVPVSLYMGAMLTGYAIVQFVAPITSVMFPRIVRSLARSEKTDALTLTLIVTGGFACLAAAGCTLFPKLPLQVLFFARPQMVQAAPLVPWFAWSLMPLTLANVLIQNLLARERFAATPWLMLVPVVYGLTLMAISPALAHMKIFDAFKCVVQTIGCFALMLFAVAAWFTWHRPETEAQKSPP